MPDPSRWWLLLLILATSPARAELLTLTGAPVAALAGRHSDQLTLARWDQGTFKPVPCQWLAWSDQRQPYFQNDHDAHREAPTDRISPRDHLLIRSGDVGPRAPSPLPAEVSATLVIDLPGTPAGYLYLLHRPPPTFSPAVVLNRNPLAIKSAHYRLTFRNHNLFQWGDFIYHGYQPPPHHGPSLLDSLKLRLSAGIFTAGTRVTLNNDNLDPTIRQVIQGPLATLLYVTTRVRVAHLPILTVHNYLILEANAMAVHSRLTLPGFTRLVLRDPASQVSVDGNALDGARLKTSWTGDLQATVDGHLSAVEKKMLEKKPGQDNWLWFGTGRGFDLLARLDFVRGFDTHARFVYQDDPALNDTPERFPGQRPNVGFRLNGIPFGDQFYFKAMLYFSDNSNGLTPGAWAHRAFQAPTVTVISARD